MKPYQIIDHPSDIGIEVTGKNEKELFENAAYAMMDMMFDISDPDTKQSFDIKVKTDPGESLLINWLSELIYISDSKNVALAKFHITKLDDKKLEARVRGGKIIAVKRSIKAATYSQLEIKKEKDHLMARIIFDV